MKRSSKVPNVLERDADKLDKLRANADLRMELIIREQKRVLKAANKGILKLNGHLRALGIRLAPYLEKNPEGKFDQKYYDLKDRYHNKLAERNALQQASQIAQESITAAQLHALPGEFDRSTY